LTPHDRHLDALLAGAIADLEEQRRIMPAVREHRSRCPEGVVEHQDLAAITRCLAAADRVHRATVALRAQAPLPTVAPRCLACAGTTGPFRGGLDNRCRMAWTRAGNPPIGPWIRRRAEVVPPSAAVVPSASTHFRTVSSGASVSDARLGDPSLRGGREGSRPTQLPTNEEG